MKYTKKPVTIEAFQLCEDYDDSCPSPEWFEDAVADGIVIRNDDKTVTIKTLEGDHLARFDDYIIKGVKGEIYPCKPDIFKMTYDIAKEDEALI